MHTRASRSGLGVLALAAGLALPGRCDPAPAAAPAGGDPPGIRVTDAAGRTVQLERLPQRIVVLGHGPYMVLDLLYMFPGASRRLVGVEKRGASVNEFLPLLDPTFQDKTALQSPGPEQIAALHPDLVLIGSRGLDQNAKALDAIHVPVVYLGLETPEQFYRDVANLGVLLGQPDRAREITAYYESRVHRIRDGGPATRGAQPPRVLVAQYTERGGAAAVRVPAKAWMQTIQVETAGGLPVWLDSAASAGGWTVTNLEQIARWDPDQIILAVSYDLDPPQVVARLEADPQWRALRAVRAGTLRAFPSDYFGWDTPDPRWILGLMWMAATLHPGNFPDLDVAVEVRTYFHTLYGLSEAAIDRNIMTRVRLDAR